MKVNQDQLLGIVRWLVTGICGFLVGRGWITAEQVPTIIAAIASLAPVAWSIWSHTDKSKVAAAQAVPQAQVVVSDPTLASPGVVVASPTGADVVEVPVPKSS